MSKIYIGIDPGVTGAVAFLSELWAKVYDMPVLAVPNGSRKETRIDAECLYAILKNHGFSLDVCELILEKTQPMKDSAMTAFSMGQTRGIILATASLLKIPIVHVTPPAWKKHFGLLKCDKDASRTIAKERFPNLMDSLQNKKDHNRAEALLIALYGKEKNL